MSIQDIAGTMCIGRSDCRLRLASPLPSGKASSTDEAFTRTRASDAFRRRSSTDSTDVPTSPDPPSAAKPPEQEPQNQKSESAQPQSHANEAFAGVANGTISPGRLFMTAI